MTVRLQAISAQAPPGGLELLQTLGAGEAGFGGTEFGRGELALADYLRKTASETDASRLPPGRLPQTTFWVMQDGTAAGLLRMRHCLNDATRVSGGHIGYYIGPPYRRQGLATQALRLALDEISAIGVTEVMLTTNPSNLGSISVIQDNGGTLTGQVKPGNGEETINQYWIRLS